MRAGFIGLGHLGRAMAGRLIAEGVELTVWNRTRQKAEGLAAAVAESPAELASVNDTVFINLFDSEAVRAVAEGKGGLLEADLGGKTVIDTTTNHFRAACGFHETFGGRGARYLEAPVLGSVAPATRGSLTVLASGSKEAYQAALAYLEKIGKNIFFLGEPGLSAKMKLINNLVLGAFMASLAEAVAMAETAGLERGAAMDILSAGAGNSLVLEAKREKLLREDFSTHFSSALIYKDLHLAQDLARELRRPLFTGHVKELFAMTFPAGLSGLDFSGVYQVLRGHREKTGG